MLGSLCGTSGFCQLCQETASPFSVNGKRIWELLDAVANSTNAFTASELVFLHQHRLDFAAESFSCVTPTWAPYFLELMKRVLSIYASNWHCSVMQQREEQDWVLEGLNSSCSWDLTKGCDCRLISLQIRNPRLRFAAICSSALHQQNSPPIWH